MRTNLGMSLVAIFLFLAPAAVAQSATGNVAESGPYAQWQLYDSQNPPTQNFEGCLVSDQHELFLVPHKGKPLLLTYAGGGENLNAVAGAYVKLRGRENIGAGRRKDSANIRWISKEGRGPTGYIMTETIIENEINVQKFTVVSPSCPADEGKAGRN